MRENYKIGQTRVAVYQTDERGQTRRIHSGIVIGVRDNWLRVFNPDLVEKGGDLSPQMAQWFAIKSPRSRCELAGELKIPLQLPNDIR